MNYIIILSEKYKGPLKMWVQNEWKYAWHNYKSDNHDTEGIPSNFCLPRKGS
jgi:hypothetical protein